MAGEHLRLTGEEQDGDGDERPAEQGSKKRRRGGDEQPGARTRRRHDSDLRSKLESVSERLAEWREGRGDDELATLIREDSPAMIGGLVSLTRPLTWLRGPLVFALSVVEPALAFGRVLRVLGGRVAERRARRLEERQRETFAAWHELSDDELAAMLSDPELDASVRADALVEQTRRTGG